MEIIRRVWVSFATHKDPNCNSAFFAFAEMNIFPVGSKAPATL